MEFLQNGKVMHYTNPSASDPILYLTPVVVGELVGVALADIAPKEEGSLAVEGVFRLPCQKRRSLCRRPAALLGPLCQAADHHGELSEKDRLCLCRQGVGGHCRRRKAGVVIWSN